MKSLSSQPHRLYISLSPVDRDDANFILTYFNAISSERKYCPIHARTKFEAAWTGLYLVLDRLPKGTKVDVLTDSRPLVRQFQELTSRSQDPDEALGVLPPARYSRHRLRVWAMICHRELGVKVLHVSRAENRARKLRSRTRR